MINLSQVGHRSKKWSTMIMVSVLVGTLLATLPAISGVAPISKASAASVVNCDTNYKLLGIIPAWYKYFGDDYGEVKTSNKFVPTTCGIVDGELTDHLLQIGLAVIDMLLRIGALVAVAFIIMGGYRYMSSQGEPKNLEAAMATIVNAAIGLGIVLTATVLVAFIGNTLGG